VSQGTFDLAGTCCRLSDRRGKEKGKSANFPLNCGQSLRDFHAGVQLKLLMAAIAIPNSMRGGDEKRSEN